MYHKLHNFTKKILPPQIYNRLIGDWDKDGLKKYSANTVWIFIGRGFSFVISFFMIAIIARYLGPENLGKLSYAQSFIAIFSMFASLGIDQILFRDLVANPEKENEIIGTSLAIKLLFGTLTILTTVSIVFFTNSDPVLSLLVLILSLSFIVEPFGITSNVFSARVKSKYSTFSKIITSIIIPVLKLIIIFFGKGIIFFAFIIILEILINVTISLFFYIRVFRRSPFQWYTNKQYGITLIKRSLPILLAGTSGYLFARIDQVMLLHELGPTSVGLYQGAVQITELVAGFLPGVIIASVIPALINAKKRSVFEYFHRLRQLLIFVISTSFIIILTISLLAPYIVAILYGESFADTTFILQIYVWSSLFYMVILILQQHLINENKTKEFFYISASTAVLNIILNITLIPIYGTFGAAIATILSLGLYLTLPIFSTELRNDYKRLFKNKELV
jgi:O-antigen/teichoic acid export membrane protein